MHHLNPCARRTPGPGPGPSVGRWILTRPVEAEFEADSTRLLIL